MNNPKIREYITYPRAVSILEKNGLGTAYRLVEFVPRKYTDYRTVKSSAQCTDGESAAFMGYLETLEVRQLKGKRKQEYIYGRLREAAGTEIKLFMFANTYLFDHYSRLKGTDVVVCGKIDLSRDFGPSITSVDDIVSANTFRPHIDAKYKKFSGISEEKLWEYIMMSMESVEEPLEEEVCEMFKVPPYIETLYRMHSPETPDDIKRGKQRLLFDELLYFSMMMAKNNGGGTIEGVKFETAAQTCEFIRKLPFRLTNDQKEVLGVMINGATAGKRNNILLQGDVGCGKTIVAACMMMCAAENGFQSVLMAPRTVLARQHFEEIQGYAEMMGRTCVFLHSGMKVREKKEAYAKIASGEADFIVGTHSCIADGVEYKNLGVVVTDEEHLFGVAQKEKIKEKADAGLHYISMSATPIPRSVAEVIYGDSKEILCIKEKPAGRKDIITKRTEKRTDIFPFIEKEIAAGHQCYVVCPAIEEDDENGLVSIEEAEKEYKAYFGAKGIETGIVNGKMKKKEVEEIMARFIEGECKILISTTVIEVGVNNPDATVIVIEQAERFGLASLHQLRGRVGRSDLQSYCFLVSGDDMNERLRTMERTNDGFEIAEADLKQRGAGNLIGVEQSGVNYFVNRMLESPKMYAYAKKAAKFCLEHGYGKILEEIYGDEPVE